jgi:hypothetical protein
MTSKLPLASLAAALALAGCNQAPQVTDNAMVNAENAVDLNSAAFNDPAPVIEEVGEEEAAAVAVVAVPAIPKGASAADTVPLADAASIEREIRTGREIRRVRYGEGLAWMRGNQILRTADRDGRNAAYFRRGDNRPFFVQRGGRSYSYQGDRPVREFDRDGRPGDIDQGGRRDAEEAARDARGQHDRAREAWRNPDRRRPGLRRRPRLRPRRPRERDNR